MAKKVIQTQHAPITKGYGDAQLATADDVEVLVDGASQTVEKVEAAQGMIYLDQAVDEGSDVEVRYHYTPNPTLEFAEFNNSGFTFNQYGNTTLESKFPFNSVFSPSLGALQPLRTGHTYTAFQRGYTSTFNDPTTLLFNEPPHAAGIPPLQRETDPQFVFFEGDAIPSGGWEVEGDGPSVAEFEENLFVINDTSTSVNVVDSTPLFYRRDLDFTYPHVTTLNFRLKVFSYSKEGDFTGIAAGYSSEDRLYSLGFLEKNGFTFAGFLGASGDESDWKSYHGLPATLIPRTVNGSAQNDRLVFSTETPLTSGDEVLVSGDVYEVSTVSVSDEGDYEVITTSEIASSGVVQVFPEMEFTQLSSYRMFKDEAGVTKAYSGGSVAPFAIIEDHDLPYEEELFELLETNEIFFGSVSRKAKSRAGWDFVRYSVLPLLPVERAPRVYVELPLTDKPEAHPTQPWTLLDDQGYSALLEDEYLLLEQAGRAQSGSYTYGRIEPFLTSQNRVELEARLRVDAYAEGMPSHITIADEQKEMTLGLFAEDVFTTPTDSATYKVSSGMAPEPVAPSLLTKGSLSPGGINPTAPVDYRDSYPGVRSFSAEGWTEDLEDITSSFVDHYHHMEKSSGTTGKVTKEVDFPENPVKNHLFSVRIRLNEWETSGVGRVSPRIGVDDGNSRIYFSFMVDSGTHKIAMVDGSGTILTDGLGDPLGFEYDWADKAFHTYKVVRSDDTISVFIDGVFQASFIEGQLPTSTRTESSELSLNFDSESVDLDLDYWFHHFTEYGTRRVGLYNGKGDLYDPTSYEFVEAEWLGTFLDVRVSRNPAGKTEVFLNGNSTPSFSKQYSELPQRQTRPELNTSLGYVQFGNADPQSHAESIWDFVRFSIHNVREHAHTLPHSIFNVAHPLTSPEPVYDETPEERLLETNTKEGIYLSPKGLKARKVLSVESEDKATSYTFSFNKDTNEITLDTSLEERRTPVWVRFLSSKPHGAKYLSAQTPVNQLNEGTPPFEKSLATELDTVEEFVSQFNEPDDVFNDDVDFTLTDGRLRIEYRVDDSMIYECLDLDSVDIDGESGLLHPMCDELGLTDITLDGYTDAYQIPEQAPNGFGQFEEEFQLDQMASLLDGDHVMEPRSESEVTGEFSDLREETYDGAVDEALDGTLTFIDGLLLDSTDALLDDVDDEMDDYNESGVVFDYTSPVNYP